MSDQGCVPQRADDNSYPVPTASQVVPKFDSSFFQGKLYITAGQNPLFDIFPCQVHFFEKTGPGKFFGKLNWRIEEPDGEFFTRDAVQAFVVDPDQPSHFLNHDNEYLHYQDDWWIIDAEPEGTSTPPFAFVYYRGSNDAWDGYGGVFVYTKESKLPKVLLPRMREAAAKIGYDFDKDFTLTDNTCPQQSGADRLLLREKFAGKAVIQTERQLQEASTRARNSATNAVQAQKFFVDDELEQAGRAVGKLEEAAVKFEKEAVEDVKRIEEGMEEGVAGGRK